MFLWLWWVVKYVGGAFEGHSSSSVGAVVSQRLGRDGTGSNAVHHQIGPKGMQGIATLSVLVRLLHAAFQAVCAANTLASSRHTRCWCCLAAGDSCVPQHWQSLAVLSQLCCHFC